MKVKFKFKPGANVVTANGLIGRVETCGLKAEGIRYHVRNDYAEEWVALSEIKMYDASVNDPKFEDEVIEDLRTDGPTPEEWIAAGYKAEHYPPQGYTAKPSSTPPAKPEEPKAQTAPETSQAEVKGEEPKSHPKPENP